MYTLYIIWLWKLRTGYYKLKSLRWHIYTKGPFYQMMQARRLQVTYNLFLYSRTAINSILSLTADHCCGCMICITLLATAYPSGASEFTPGFEWSSCYSIFSFMCMFVDRCLSLFLLDIVLSVLLRYTDSDYPLLVSSNSSSKQIIVSTYFILFGSTCLFFYLWLWLIQFSFLASSYM